VNLPAAKTTRWKLACALFAALAGASVLSHRSSAGTPVALATSRTASIPPLLRRPLRVTAEAAGISRGDLVDRADGRHGGGGDRVVGALAELDQRRDGGVAAERAERADRGGLGGVAVLAGEREQALLRELALGRAERLDRGVANGGPVVLGALDQGLDRALAADRAVAREDRLGDAAPAVGARQGCGAQARR